MECFYLFSQPSENGALRSCAPMSGWIVLGSVGGSFQPIVMGAQGQTGLSGLGMVRGLAWELTPNMSLALGIGAGPRPHEDSKPWFL